MELIHVATLIHDDVVDNASLRRGKDSTNNVHGNRFSVLAGDYLFSWVFKKITQSYDNPVPTILASMLSEICNGEVKQLRATGNLSLRCEQYFEIIGKKTAELFAACAEVGSIVALQRELGKSGPALRDHPVVKTLRAYGWAFGMAFQIRDDVLDVIASEAALGKPAGSDLRERKVTLPLILALEAEGAKLRGTVAALFSGDKGDIAADLLSDIVNQLRSSIAIAHAKRVVAEYEQRARTALAKLAPSKAVAELEALTRNLSEYSP
jgi:geranylgeranyl pyrophosphate synthase